MPLVFGPSIGPADTLAGEEDQDVAEAARGLGHHRLPVGQRHDFLPALDGRALELALERIPGDPVLAGTAIQAGINACNKSVDGVRLPVTTRQSRIDVMGPRLGDFDIPCGA
jgi:hypothetical protein